MEKKHLTARFSFLQGAYFAVFSVCSGFLSILLQDAGVLTHQIGTMQAVLCFACALAQPIMGILCDKYQANRIIYMAGAVAAPILFYIIARTQNKAVLVVTVFFIGMFINSLQSMGEGWVANLNHFGAKINFGATRGVGSFVYSFAVLFMGVIYNRFGGGAFAWILIILGAVQIVAAYVIPKPIPVHSQTKISTKEALGVLVKNKKYCVFVFCYLLTFFPMAAFMTYFPLLFTQLGGSAGGVGIAFFIMSIGELPMMFLYKRFESKLGVEKMFIISCFGHAAKSICVALSGSLALAIVFSVFQVLGFALSIPCAQSYVEKIVEAKYAATAQLVCATVALSIGQILGNLLAGVLSKAVGVSGTLFLTGLIPLGGIVIFIIAQKLLLKSKS
ncbi:MAG: MFS transporter [Oscillospiraceae bacterium]|nr:MFS transporter [Oscillospiraceae bacterium]